jgi:hypothetical protein
LRWFEALYFKRPDLCLFQLVFIPPTILIISIFALTKFGSNFDHKKNQSCFDSHRVLLFMHSIILLSLLITVFSANPLFMIRDQNTSRFSNIYYPTKESDSFNADLFWVDFVIAPAITVDKVLPSMDICMNMQNILSSRYPLHWDNTSITSCRNYFCGLSKPFLLTLGGNMSFPLSDRIIYNDTHVMMHTYCTLCNQTSVENFTGDNCQWFTKQTDYCLTTCAYNTTDTCIYMNQSRPMCYSPSANTFYRYYVPGSIGVYQYYFIGSPILWGIDAAISFVFLFFLLFLPELKDVLSLLSELRSNVTVWTRIRTVMKIRFQCILLLMFSTVIVCVACIVDLSLTFIIRFYVVICFIRGGILLMVNVEIVILWKHICEMADDLAINDRNPSLHLGNYVLLIVFYVIFALFAIGGALLYALYTFIDQGIRVFWVYFIGSWLLVMCVVGGILVIMLNIYSLRLWRIYNSANTQSQLNFMKLKVTSRS